MARRASGISGLVYGISVNVKHAFLRRKGRKKINGNRNLKDSKKDEETLTPACSQKCARVLLEQFTSKHSLWYKTNTTSDQSAQLPQGEVKQEKTEN